MDKINSLNSLLKNIFPSYIVYNATNKTIEENFKIENICIGIHNLIVFVIRTKQNENYFKFYEKKSNIKNDIQILFFNKDDYMYFEEMDINEGMIRFLKMFINNECECSIWCEKYNGFIRNLLLCRKCVHSVCNTCIKQMCSYSKQSDILCPICRSFIIAFFV